jgi:IS5 family transposase
MAHRRIGHERLDFAASRERGSALDELSRLIVWDPIMVLLKPVHASAKGEAAWPPLAMFRALLLSVWCDLSDVKLAEALDDRASFRRFCGFSNIEPTPGLCPVSQDAGGRRSGSRPVRGGDPAIEDEGGSGETIVDATIIPSASEGDDEG